MRWFVFSRASTRPANPCCSTRASGASIGCGSQNDQQWEINTQHLRERMNSQGICCRRSKRARACFTQTGACCKLEECSREVFSRLDEPKLQEMGSMAQASTVNFLSSTISVAIVDCSSSILRSLHPTNQRTSLSLAAGSIDGDARESWSSGTHSARTAVPWIVSAKKCSMSGRPKFTDTGCNPRDFFQLRVRLYGPSRSRLPSCYRQTTSHMHGTKK